MLEFSISGLGDWGGVPDDLMGALTSGIQEELRYIQEMWRNKVEEVGPASGANWKAYLRSLDDSSAIVYPVDGDPLWGKVTIANDRIAQRAERGGPAWDMKPGLLSGPKARKGKKGRYNIIPLGYSALKPGAFSPGRMSGMLAGTSPFRIVSDNSPADSWIYPEQEGLHVLKTVQREVTRHVVDKMTNILAEWKK